MKIENDLAVLPSHDIGHLLMLGANYLLHVFGVGFQLYSQLK